MNVAPAKCVLVVSFFLFTDGAAGQGALTVLNTGGGQPLVSEVRSLTADAGLIQPRVLFDFGFATAEQFVPGTFLDSFTVSVQSSNGALTVIYLTTDASGLVLAPMTPGALFIDPATINAEAIAYPSLQPVLPNRIAFSISALLPVQFLGGSMNVFFDLFDNLDSQASQGWFSNLRLMSVPEPSATALLALGCVLMWRNWARPRTSHRTQKSGERFS